jgi:rhodanese-related sulfurtransferase
MKDKASGPNTLSTVARTSINQLLERARARLRRLDALQAREAVENGATLIDIRSDAQRAADGSVPGALYLPRNVLEWRLDPDSGYRHADAPALDGHVIIMCNEGYQSSLAAATLQDLGFKHATDLDGGFQAWRAAGLPVDAGTR